MILVDSSVWVDYFRGVAGPATDRLDALLGVEPLAIGDLMLAEVLQGFATERGFHQALDLFSALTVVDLGGEEIAVQAARNFRLLRRRGITVRKSIDTVIATYCIGHGCELLHSDRDFDPFVKYLGLRSVD